MSTKTDADQLHGKGSLVKSFLLDYKIFVSWPTHREQENTQTCSELITKLTVTVLTYMIYFTFFQLLATEVILGDGQYVLEVIYDGRTECCRNESLNWEMSSHFNSPVSLHPKSVHSSSLSFNVFYLF